MKNNKIICTCGHEIDTHWGLHCNDAECDCRLDKKAVEARYWAFHYYAHFQQLLKEYEKMKIERNKYKDDAKKFFQYGVDTRIKLDEAKEVIEDLLLQSGAIDASSKPIGKHTTWEKNAIDFLLKIGMEDE